MSPGPRDILAVVRRNRRFFGGALVLSAALHAALFAWMATRPEVEEERIVARFEFEEEETPFYVSAPRLVREFAFRKQAVPEGSPVVSPRSDRTATVVRGGLTRTAVTGSVEWTRSRAGGEFVLPTGDGEAGGALVGIPRFEPFAMTSLKEPEKRIDMETEFLDLAALDIGKVKSLVIQDPTDKRNITGFIYLGLAWGTVLEPSRKRSMIQLARWINDHTRIEAKVDDQMYLDSQDLFKAPFVYITTDRAFELTAHEAASLDRYLRSGGFVVADNDLPQMQHGPAEASLRQMFRHALGRDARFERIPDIHPIYHVFFDLAGPPPGGEVGVGAAENQAGRRASHWLEGIYLDGRLVAVYSDKGYGAFWERENENEPHVKLGINLVVFALTQRGSIAQQQIDFYNQ